MSGSPQAEDPSSPPLGPPRVLHASAGIPSIMISWGPHGRYTLSVVHPRTPRRFAQEISRPKAPSHDRIIPQHWCTQQHARNPLDAGLAALPNASITARTLIGHSSYDAVSHPLVGVFSRRPGQAHIKPTCCARKVVYIRLPVHWCVSKLSFVASVYANYAISTTRRRDIHV